MKYQGCGSYGQLPTHCAGCGALLPGEFNRFFCAKCQDRMPVSGHVTMDFETVEAGDSEGGIRVSVGNATKILFWEDFEEPVQLWNRVGELVQHALVWGPTRGTWRQVETKSEPAEPIDADNTKKTFWSGNLDDLLNFRQFWTRPQLALDLKSSGAMRKQNQPARPCVMVYAYRPRAGTGKPGRRGALPN